MADIIKLKPVSEIGEGLGPGEYAIDETNRQLILDSDSTSTYSPIDLDVSYVPVADSEALEQDYAVFMGTSGPEYRPYTMGAGGVPMDYANLRWVVPGVIPIDIDSAYTITASWAGEIEVNAPIEVKSLRINPSSGVDISLTYGIRTLEGADIISYTDSAYAGVIVNTLDQALDPGRYVMFVTCESSLDFQAIKGYLPWARQDVSFPIQLHVTSNAPA